MIKRSTPFILICLFLLIALVPAAVWSFKNMQLNSSIQQVMESDERAKASYQKFNEAFDSKNAVVVIAKIPELFSNEGAQTLFDMSQALATLPHLKDIKSLTHSGRPVRHGFNLDVSKMIQIEAFMDTKPRTAEEWQKLQRFTTQYPMTKNILVSEDGNYAIIMAVLSESLNSLQEKEKTMELTRSSLLPFQRKGIELNFLSETFITTEFYELTISFLTKYAIFSLILSSLIILLVFRSLSILLFMSCNQICGLLTFPLIFYLNYTDINIYTFIIIPLISAIQLTFLTHFYSVFKRHMNHEEQLSSIFQKCLSTTFFPSFLAMLTTAIGLITLCFSQIPIIQSVGCIGLQALLAIFTLTFLPPYLLSLSHKSKERSETKIELESNYQLRFMKAAKIISSALLTIAIFSSFFIANLETDVRTKEFLHSQSETRKSIELIDQKIGGVNVFELKVKTAGPGQAQSYQTLKFCHEFRKKILEFPEIYSAYSYSQLYTVIHQLFLGDNFSIGNQFPPPIQASLYSQIINNQKFPFQNILQNEDLSETTLFIRTRDLPSKAFLGVIQKVLDLSTEIAPKGVSIEIKDGIHSLLASDRKIVKSQIQSLIGSLCCIFILFLTIWKSLRLATIAIVVNSIPLIILFGTMVFFGLSLNSVNVMVAPIILGISVDDSIHFICYMQNLMKKGNSDSAALATTLKHKFRPITCTTLILICCLSLFFMAPFPPIQIFGTLGASTLLFALLCTLLLLPVLLSMHKNTCIKRKE